ncbi:anaerobic selenocysteine-containing dehydrogenase [Actinocorallia herbida]|uniref:Anaerobic selenocysteine-containing dehydrogenase n=1 Tax=Actinocorallia herbida TaxID=58109 RepID=A0A3N1DBR5_9ACTN|nr:molybdopterin-dependent oxidoreductase [Actinocorallia herbida]ROO90964.1 anaerobic selenocysteine-containing dehydrogenase [Actinocorallia herbida]
MSRIATRTCPLCEALCGLELTLEGDKVTKVRGDRNDPFSKGFICPKGASFGKLDNDPHRLAAPLVDGAEATWEEAFQEVGRSLRRVIDTYGKDAVGVYYGNPSAHSVAGSLYGTAVIKGIGTRNVFSASTSDQMPKHVAAGYVFGDPLAIPVPDLDRTGYLLMLGANPLESNGSLCSAPNFPGRLKAIRARGGRITVIDPRRTRTAELADEHVPIRPGGDAWFLFSLVDTLLGDGLAEPRHEVANLDRLRHLAAEFTAEATEPLTGIPAATTRRIARELAAAETAAVYGRIGTCTQEFGTLASWLIDVLNILTGNLDRPGGVMFPKAAHSFGRRSRPYRTGRWHSRVRGLPEANGELPVAALAEEIETEGEGQIKALITIGGNPVLSAPGGDRIGRALENLEFMVSVDPYLNETTAHANVVLPPPPHTRSPHYDVALLSFAVQNYARYSPPVVDRGDRPAESEIIARIAGEILGVTPEQLDETVIQSTLKKAGREDLRAELGPPNAETRLDMMVRLGPYGVTLDDLVGGRLIGPLEPRLAEVLVLDRIDICPDLFAADVDRMRASRTSDGFVLIGRRHLRSNNSWMHQIDGLTGGTNTCTLRLHPDDAADLGIAAGSLVTVASRTGSLEVEAEPNDEIMRGVVSLPHGWGHARPGTRLGIPAGRAGVSANTLTDESTIDVLSGNAVFNGVPVTVTPVG